MFCLNIVNVELIDHEHGKQTTKIWFVEFGDGGWMLVDLLGKTIDKLIRRKYK